MIKLEYIEIKELFVLEFSDDFEFVGLIDLLEELEVIVKKIKFFEFGYISLGLDNRE